MNQEGFQHWNLWQRTERLPARQHSAVRSKLGQMALPQDLHLWACFPALFLIFQTQVSYEEPLKLSTPPTLFFSKGCSAANF